MSEKTEEAKRPRKLKKKRWNDKLLLLNASSDHSSKNIEALKRRDGVLISR